MYVQDALKNRASADSDSDSDAEREETAFRLTKPHARLLNLIVAQDVPRVSFFFFFFFLLKIIFIILFMTLET
jgi:hypothetical protein